MSDFIMLIPTHPHHITSHSHSKQHRQIDRQTHRQTHRQTDIISKRFSGAAGQRGTHLSACAYAASSRLAAVCRSAGCLGVFATSFASFLAYDGVSMPV
jgi:hypothetical protein